MDGVTVVTGGTGGLGIGVVRTLVAHGHEAVVTWVMEHELEAFPEDLREQCTLEHVNVLDPDEVGALAARLDRGAGVWAVAHLVGGYQDGAPLDGGGLPGWERQMDLNLRAAAVMMDAFLPGMRRRGRGRFVAVSSRAGLRPFAGAGAYAASKAGLVALVGAASEEVKHDGVCVNCVLPSVIDTPANRAANPDADTDRWVKPEDLGEVIAFLCSPQARAVTGAAIPAYGRS